MAVRAHAFRRDVRARSRALIFLVRMHVRETDSIQRLALEGRQQRETPSRPPVSNITVERLSLETQPNNVGAVASHLPFHPCRLL